MARGLQNYMLNAEEPMLSQAEPGYEAPQGADYQDEIDNVAQEMMMADQMQQQAAAVSPLDNYMPAEPAMNQMASEAQRQQMMDMQSAQDMQKKAALAENQGIGQLEQYIQDYSKRKSNTDLSPLAAYLDNWRGGHMAEYAKAAAGESPDERAQKLIGLQNMLIQREQAQAKRFQDGGRQQRFDTGLDLKKEDNIRKDINKVQDSYTKTQGDLDTAQSAINRGDMRTVQMVITSIAKNVGEQKGSLSDGDIQRSMPSDIATNIAGLQAFLGSPNAKISPQLQQALNGLIDRARNNSQNIYKDTIQRREKQYSAGSYKPLMQAGQVGRVIFDEALGRGQEQAPVTGAAPTTPPVQKAKAPTTPKVMSPEQWLKKKRGG